MTAAEFKARLLDALQSHFPDAKIKVEEKRGVVISIRAEIAAGALIQAYFSGITSKTSYALIRGDQRILGYDNYRFWHKHPSDSPDKHQKCDEPSPESVIAEMHEGYLRLCQ
jgi:hypothetical protein